MEHEHEQERANRSDTHLPREEEARMEAETREHFEGLAPKRHSKPQRSDYSDSYLDQNTHSNAIPEYVEFTLLEGRQEKLVCSSGQAAEEFVETDYYKDLNLVDKQHHTTGTGFIKQENVKGNSTEYYHHVGQENDDYSHRLTCSNGNPATNDWIPAKLSGQEDFVSGKPSRSDI